MSLMLAQQFAQINDPAVSNVFKVGLESVTDIASQVMKRSTRSIEELEIISQQFGGPEMWEQRDDGQPPKFDQLFEGFGVTLTTQEFKKPLLATERMIEGNRHQQVLDKAKNLGVGAARMQQRTGADVYNDGFTVADGGDGQALFANAHPYPLKSPMRGSDQDNLGVAVLETDGVALSAARLALFAQLDDVGDIALDDGQKLTLLVPPALEDTASILINSQQTTDNANNDINVNYNRFDLVVWTRLSTAAGGSDTAWIILHPDHRVVFFDRVLPDIVGPIIDKLAHTVAWSGRASWVPGYEAWQGTYGSTGAGS